MTERPPIATTGAAIAAYLKEERPKTRNRAVFVRHVAPRDQPVGPDLVRKTIRQAYARAGLPYTSSHLLRHKRFPLFRQHPVGPRPRVRILLPAPDLPARPVSIIRTSR